MNFRHEFKLVHVRCWIQQTPLYGCHLPHKGIGRGWDVSSLGRIASTRNTWNMPDQHPQRFHKYLSSTQRKIIPSDEAVWQICIIRPVLFSGCSGRLKRLGEKETAIKFNRNLWFDDEELRKRSSRPKQRQWRSTFQGKRAEDPN